MDDVTEVAYSPSSMVGGSATPFLEDYAVRSAKARAELGDRVVVLADGSLLVPPTPGEPTLVFVHGGYWQSLSAAESLFLAPPATANGWGYAAVEYTIAPQAPIEQMIDEVGRGLVEVAEKVGGRLVVAGHSAGAQLVAMNTLVQEPAADIRKCVLVSGVLDLRDLPRTSMNIALGLDAERATALSPVVQPVRVTSIPVEVWWAARDTPRFAEMSVEYAAVLAAAGCEVSGREVAGTHHFDIVDHLVGLTAPG